MTILKSTTKQLIELIDANLPAHIASEIKLEINTARENPSEAEIALFMDALDALEEGQPVDGLVALVKVERDFYNLMLDETSIKDKSKLLLMLCSRHQLGINSFKYLESRLCR